MPKNLEKPQPSYRKLAANRANALKSTGPRTLQGKAISSQNGSKAPVFTRALAAALDETSAAQTSPEPNCSNPTSPDQPPQYVAQDFIDFSIFPGESRNDFAILHQQFLDDFKPQSPTELMIVEQMSRNEWNILRLQASLFYGLQCQILSTSQGTPSERVVKVISNAAGTRAFESLERALTRAQRLRSRLIKDLDLSRRVRQEHAQSTVHHPAAPGPLDCLPIRPVEPNIAEKNVRPNPPNESLILNFPRAPYTIALPNIDPEAKTGTKVTSRPSPSVGERNEAA